MKKSRSAKNMIPHPHQRVLECPRNNTFLSSYSCPNSGHPSCISIIAPMQIERERGDGRIKIMNEN